MNSSSPNVDVRAVARLEALARLMDGAFVVPGPTIRFGLDGIIGLIPGSAIPVVGDAFDVLIRANMKNTDKAASTPQRYQLSDCRAHCRHEQQAGLEPDGLLAVV
jgi:Domain of unknown function (DUF4112)